MLRKQRTRGHIIADLSANYVERRMLLAGHVVLPITKDYGYDLAVYTHNSLGEPETGNILIQLKATDNLRWNRDQTALLLSLDTRDLEYWRYEIMPVILILYDAQADEAYWLYMQSYLRDLPTSNLARSSITVLIPCSNVFDDDAVKRIRQLKVSILRLFEGTMHHES